MVDKYIIHHDASSLLHITISVKQVCNIYMACAEAIHGNMLIMAIIKISKS